MKRDNSQTPNAFYRAQMMSAADCQKWPTGAEGTRRKKPDVFIYDVEPDTRPHWLSGLTGKLLE